MSLSVFETLFFPPPVSSPGLILGVYALFYVQLCWKTWRWVDKASEGANVPSYGASHEGVKPETPCWSVGERAYVLTDQSPGGVTPSCAISLLHTFSFVHLHKENTDLWSQPVLPRLWFTRHMILFFLSRHGKVALNSGVVERKPFSFAWKELKSNNCLSFHSPCGIRNIINT